MTGNAGLFAGHGLIANADGQGYIAWLLSTLPKEIRLNILLNAPPPALPGAIPVAHVADASYGAYVASLGGAINDQIRLLVAAV